MSEYIQTAFYIKDPEATLTYTLSWGELATETNYLVSSSWTVSGLDIISDTFDPTNTSVLLGGGVDGTTYYVTNSVATLNNEVDEKVLKISVSNQKDIYDLLFELRLHLGDYDPTSYRYMDKWLVTSLLLAVKSLQKWWNYRYLVDFNTEDVYRNPNIVFEYAEPPVIQDSDVRPIILMASIIIKKGQLENSAWSTGSWRDNEISVSNIEGSRVRQTSLNDDWNELKDLLRPPQKKLAQAVKGRLPGYFSNEY